VKDKNMTITYAANTVTLATTHFSTFSLVVDYSKPAITDMKINGNVVTAKITDTGSGINTAVAGSYLSLGGVKYVLQAYNQTTGNVSFIANPAVALETGNYIYGVRIADKVGNFVEATGRLDVADYLTLAESHNYPNPFDPNKEDTTIRFTLSKPSIINIKVYDFNGDLVSVLARNDGVGGGIFGAKEYRWGGTNDNGKKVSNGTYFCEIVASGSDNSAVGRTSRDIIKIAVLRRK
ncbi:MAG: hypothetical protein Q7K21_07775, partial [Elusimicrobiota bacterium]|nr:hypothetical protein [Elusimicrobiota bacterium]